MFCGRKTDCRELKANGKGETETMVIDTLEEGAAKQADDLEWPDHKRRELFGRMEGGLCITKNHEEEPRDERFKMQKKEGRRKMDSFALKKMNNLFS